MAKKNKYNMNSEAAGLLLQNVLSACDKPESSVSVQEVVREKERKKDKLRGLTILCIVMLMLTFCVPLLFEHPPIYVQQKIYSSEFKLESNYVLNGNVFLTFQGQEVDPQNARLVTRNGMIFTPTSVDPDANSLSFPFDESFGNCNITVDSKDGSRVQVVISPKKDQ